MKQYRCSSEALEYVLCAVRSEGGECAGCIAKPANTTLTSGRSRRPSFKSHDRNSSHRLLAPAAGKYTMHWVPVIVRGDRVDCTAVERQELCDMGPDDQVSGCRRPAVQILACRMMTNGGRATATVLILLHDLKRRPGIKEEEGEEEEGSPSSDVDCPPRRNGAGYIWSSGAPTRLLGPMGPMGHWVVEMPRNLTATPRPRDLSIGHACKDPAEVTRSGLGPPADAGA